MFSISIFFFFFFCQAEALSSSLSCLFSDAHLADLWNITGTLMMCERLSAPALRLCVFMTHCQWRSVEVHWCQTKGGGQRRVPRATFPLGLCRKFKIMWDDKRWYLNLKQTTTWAVQGGSVSPDVMNSTSLRTTWYFQVFSPDLSCWDGDQRQTDWGGLSEVGVQHTKQDKEKSVLVFVLLRAWASVLTVWGGIQC